jgi:hypothetical protein
MTATLLRNTTATDEYNFDFGRGVVTRSDGIMYAASLQSDGNIHIYEISADRSTVNNRISITPSSSETPQRISIALDPNDNSLHVAYQDRTKATNNLVRWLKVNTSAWTTTSWSNVTGAVGPSASVYAFDLDVTDTGIPIIATLQVGVNVAGLEVYCRNTSNNWVNSGGTTLYTGSTPTNFSGSCISVITLAATSGVRDVVIAAGAGVGNIGLPVNIFAFRITESNGNLSGSIAPAKLNTLMSNTMTVTGNSRKRNCRLFRDGTNTYIFGGMAQDTKSLHFHKGSFNAGTWTNLVSEKTSVWSNKSFSRFTMSFGYAPGGHAVTYCVKDSGGILWTKVAFNDGSFAGGEGRYSPDDKPVFTISDASVPFPDITPSPILVAITDGSNNKLYEIDNLLPAGLVGITQLTPADDAINQPAAPTLSGLLATGLKYGTGLYEVEFQFASDSSFTTSLVTYRQPVSKGTYIDGTDAPGATVIFSDTLAGSLGNGVWFYRARITDMWGNVGGWTTAVTFSVGHPPSAVLTSPVNGGYYNWSGGQPTFTWVFTDPSGGDFQTAYQVQLYDADGDLVLDTGKVTSSQKSFTPSSALDGSLKDTQMSWQVKLWDSQDTAGLFSDLQTFILTDPPSVTITSPDSGEEVGTGVPVYTFTGTTGGSRHIKGYSILVTSGGNIVYSGPLVSIDVSSGASIDSKQPPNYLQNNSSYTVQISVVDDAGLVGVSSFTQFTVAWTPPASVTGIGSDVSAFDLEGAGYNLLTWSDSARASGFTHWTIYRKADLIDDSGTLLEEGTWVKVGDDFDLNEDGTYAYKDYLAPANYLVTYAVTQWVNVDGQDMESDKSDSSSDITTSEAYWLINIDEANNSASTFKMSIVTDDSFTEEQEESEFTVIGRGRLVNRGQYLGPKGSIAARLRSTGLLTARQKRLQLLAIQQEVGEMQLRNPFGDVWNVNMSNMAVSRIAGVGASEFCDVTIPYSEVS